MKCLGKGLIKGSLDQRFSPIHQDPALGEHGFNPQFVVQNQQVRVLTGEVERNADLLVAGAHGR